MIVIGIDPSLSSTGYSVFVGTTFLKGGTIEPNCKQSVNDRINYITDQLETVIDPFVSDNVRYMAIESEAYGATGHVVQLAELTGGVKHVAMIRNCKILSYTPSQAKKLVLGHGKIKWDKNKEPKKYITHIRTTFPIHLDINSDKTDAHDAAILGMAACIELTGPINETLVVMRLHDERILTKSKNGSYTYGTGKKKVKFKKLSTLDKEVRNELIERYCILIGRNNPRT